MKTSIPCTVIASLALLAAACSGSPKTGTVTQGGGGETADDTTGGDDTIAPLPSYGADCGPGDACAEGLECLSYYGIAGARGPEFKTCEHPCGGDSDCSDGTACATIMDGPGRVCR